MIELKIHKTSFKKLKMIIKKKFPKLKIEFNVMSLDNSFTKIK